MRCGYRPLNHIEKKYSCAVFRQHTHEAQEVGKTDLRGCSQFWAWIFGERMEVYVVDAQTCVVEDGLDDIS